LPTIQLRDQYLGQLDRALYTLDPGTQFNYLNSFIRSVLQTVSISALECCYENTDDIEQTVLPELAASMLSPSDGTSPRIINTCIPLIQQSGWPSCCITWFMPSNCYLDETTAPLARHVDTWVNYRNDRPGHGVVAEGTIREALSWLPKLARELVLGLADLLPEILEDGSLIIHTFKNEYPKPISLYSLQLTSEKGPIVIRGITPRGPSWRVKYQSLDLHTSFDGTYELTQNAPLIALTRLEQRLFRSHTVHLSDGTIWRPTVLLPTRQTPNFEGRTSELKALEDWMNDIDSRACNVFGGGGIGKTTLVIEYLNTILSGNIDPPKWQPIVICFFSAKETRWGPEGLQYLRGAIPSVADAAREIVRSYEERLEKMWFEGDARQTIDRAETLMNSLGIKRTDILLILDNSETLVRSKDEEGELGKLIYYMARKLCRILVTSRRREQLEAHPIQVPPMSDREGALLLRKLGVEYSAQSLKQSSEKTLEKINRKFSGTPLLLDVVARLVGKFGYSLDRGVQAALSLAAGDLGTFLYEDAWTRIGHQERQAFLVIGQLGGVVTGDIIGWLCAELNVPHTQVLNAFEETRFGLLQDYGSRYDLSMDPSARSFLTQKFTQADKTVHDMVERTVSRVQRKYKQWVQAQSLHVGDRVAEAFRTEAAKAAHQAAEANKVEEAIQWYEEAIQIDRGNTALLDRFAWYLMREPKDLPRALKVAQEACASNPNDTDAHFTAGMIYARMAEISKADEMFERAQRLGKAPHLCALQQVYARHRAVEKLFSSDPIDATRVEKLLREGLKFVHKSKLTHAVSTLDAKHEAEREKMERSMTALTERLAFLIKIRKATRTRK